MYSQRPGGQDPNAAQYHYPPPPPPPNASQSPASAQPNGAAYPPASAPPQQQPTSLPSINEYPQPNMAVHHPPHQPPPPGYPPAGYPPPPGHYPPPYRPTHDPYRPPPQAYAPYPPQNQPAPRQRTAIACRYCRRRKIRCSGFDQSEDGRCANCQRFSQECIFTPVSAQTQAFVPAHAAFRGQPIPAQAQLYGAYGQPLPPNHSPHDPYAASRPPAYTLPSPTVHYPPPHSQYPTPPAGQPPLVYPPVPHDQTNGVNGSRKADQPHTPTLPPPGGPGDFRYPDPASVGQPPVSPASNTSHNSAQAYYPGQAQQPPRRSPPQTASPYTQEARASASPHTQSQPTYPPYPGEQGLRAIPVRSDGRTPPPPTSTPSQNGQTATSQAGGARPGITISSIVSGDGSSPGARSQEDRDMLQRLGK